HGPCESKAVGGGVLPHCESFDVRAAWIRKAEEFGHFVERLAGGVVSRGAEQAVAAPVLHIEQHRVAARDEQRRERRTCVRMLERGGEQVPFHVVYPDGADAVRPGERLTEAEADEEGADES